jgi:hypothetical protein
MTAQIDEIAPDLYRICLYVPAFDLQFNHFLVKDEEPLLFHTGMRGMFPAVRKAVAKLIDPASLRWISWSHFEVDECGALNEWLAAAPNAIPVCGEVGPMVNIADFSNRPPRALKPDEILQTGRHRFRFVPTPHLPHGWDAGCRGAARGTQGRVMGLLSTCDRRECFLSSGLKGLEHRCVAHRHWSRPSISPVVDPALHAIYLMLTIADISGVGS